MKRILVVDDDPLIRQLCRDILKGLGFEIVDTGNPLEALNIWNTYPFDLLITDIRMPVMSGLDLMAKIKEKSPDAAFIVITGHGDYRLAVEAIKLGVYDFINKPFRREDLEMTVRDVIYKLELLNEINRLKMFTRLHMASSEIMHTFDIPTAVKFGLENALKETKASEGAIYIYETDQGRFNKLYSIPEHLEMAGPILEKAFKSDTPLIDDGYVVTQIGSMKRSIGVLGLRYTDGRLGTADPEAVVVISRILGITIDNILLFKDLKNKIKEIEDLLISIIKALSNALDAKSPWTKGHSERVSRYSLMIAEEMGLGSESKNILEMAALLHDIGKIGMYDYILNKPDKLLPQEFEIVKLHPVKGAEILRPINQLNEVIRIISHHHEHYDGSGYPDGLKGEEIPLLSRILQVADAYDAMTSERPYRKIPGKRRAIEELRICSGRQFDPMVVDAFIRALDKRIYTETEQREGKPLLIN
ncbi:MAG: response regulator [Thermodesulfovibrionales bacterium]|nr:response regulator [Thermodesulfovibrionales bacterium]